MKKLLIALTLISGLTQTASAQTELYQGWQKDTLAVVLCSAMNETLDMYMECDENENQFINPGALEFNIQQENDRKFLGNMVTRISFASSLHNSIRQERIHKELFANIYNKISKYVVARDIKVKKGYIDGWLLKKGEELTGKKDFEGMVQYLDDSFDFLDEM